MQPPKRECARFWSVIFLRSDRYHFLWNPLLAAPFYIIVAKITSSLLLRTAHRNVHISTGARNHRLWSSIPRPPWGYLATVSRRFKSESLNYTRYLACQRSEISLRVRRWSFTHFPSRQPPYPQARLPQPDPTVNSMSITQEKAQFPLVWPLERSQEPSGGARTRIRHRFPVRHPDKKPIGPEAEISWRFPVFWREWEPIYAESDLKC